MRNIKVVLAYDGTDFHGFQIQREGLRTVQATLEEVLGRLTGEKVGIIGAGRTDAGVHARGQVINFHTEWSIPVERVVAALNGALPPDVVALGAHEVPAEFHARYCALAKTYRYTVLNSPLPDPFLCRYSSHVRQPLDLTAMAAAADYLTGTRDFVAFMASGSAVRQTVRTMSRASVTRGGKLIYFTFRADGFLYNMVRIMVGTLLLVGLGRLAPADLPHILAARDRSLAGPTAPPHGLCLMEVEY